MRSAATQTRGKGTLTIRITVPPKTARGNARRPDYLSPSTAGIIVTFDPGTQQQFAMGRIIETQAAGCSTSLPLVCSFSVELPPGHHKANFSTYDKPPIHTTPQGNLLSQNLGIPLDVKAGQANAFNVTLQGIPTGLVVISDPDQDVTGSQSAGFVLWGAEVPQSQTVPYPRVFTVLATDADGNYIFGSGAPTVSLTSNNPTAITNGISALANPNRFTITPSNDPAILQYQYQFTATATPSKAAGSNSGSKPVSVKFPMNISVEMAPSIYVLDQDPLKNTCGIPQCGKISVFDEHGTPLQTATPFTGLRDPGGLCYFRGDGEIYVTDTYDNKILTYLYDGTSTTSVGGFPGLNAPVGIACDTHSDRIYVGQKNGPVQVFDAAGDPIAVSGNWMEKEGTVIGNAQSIMVDDTIGYIWVADSVNGHIEVYDHTGTAIASWSPAQGTYGVSEDPTTLTVYNGSQSGGLINTYQLGGQTIALPGAGFPGLTQPTGIAYDSVNGHFYVSDYATNSTLTYDTNGNPIPLPSGAFAGPVKPVGVTVML